MSFRPDALEDVDVTRAVVEQYLEDLHTLFAARVERYDASTQRADVVPLVRHAVAQPDGSVTYESLPVLPSVPVLFPRFGRWFLSFPVAVGDTVLVGCQESAHGHWEAGNGDPQYPGDLRRHHLSNAVVLAGYAPAGGALVTVSSADLVLGNEDGTRIVIRADGTIELVSGSVNFVALANLVQDALNTIRSAFNLHTHGGGTSGGNTLVPNALLAALGPVAANKVKAT